MDSVSFGTNQFCGPSVISAICGITTDEAAGLISSITGSKRKITGVYERDLIAAFNSIGYACNRVNWAGSSVFAALFSLHGKDGTYVFTVPGHYIAIEVNGNHKFICDNHSKSPINVSNSARLSQKVVSIFRVVKK